MEKHEGLDHMQDRNYVHWDITTVCNYSCEYCYAMKEYGSDWNKEASRETIKSILASLYLSSMPVFLGLLGGEPTFSKHFDFILAELRENFFKRDKDRVYITTNLSRSLDWYKAFPEADYYYNKLFFLASFHSTEANPEAFLQNIKMILDKGYKVKINIMINNNSSDWGATKDLLKRTKVLQGQFKEKNSDKLIIHPHFVYENEHQLFDYPNNLDEYFGDLIQGPKEYIQDDVMYCDREIFEKKLNNFYGSKCFLNNYEIDLKGNVYKFCTREHNNLLDDPTFFKKIKRTLAIICQHKACTCDGLLKIKKEN